MILCFIFFQAESQFNNHFDQQKTYALGVLRYGLGSKQPRFVIFGIQISRFGIKMCPNELIFHAHIEENFIHKNAQSTLKKNQNYCWVKIFKGEMGIENL